MDSRIAQLTAEHAAAYRALMLHGYEHAPDAFTSTPEERAAEPLAWWIKRIDDPKGMSLAFGAFVGDELAGTVALEFSSKPKTRHKAHVIGMYVLAQHRGLGLGRKLVEAAMRNLQERPGVTLATLTVTEGNAPAIALYGAAGFRAFGTEPMAILTPSGYRAKVHMCKQFDSHVAFEPVVPEDFEALADIRVAAMRESLKRVGRFDPARARERLRAGFAPEHTRHIVAAGERVGFVVLKPQGEHLLLDHLYVLPSHQGRGIGAQVLAHVFTQADAQHMPIRVGALRESASNRFYQRHGFQLVEEAEFDNYYIRDPAPRG
jgi:ribosomal protein S18 acetylase RimI-like enzyme